MTAPMVPQVVPRCDDPQGRSLMLLGIPPSSYARPLERHLGSARATTPLNFTCRARLHTAIPFLIVQNIA